MADLAPPIDYTAADYPQIRADVLRRAETLFPEWTSRSEADFGVMLAELFSHTADLNNYAIDRLLREAFLPTATTRQSVLLLADMLGYIPHGTIAATGTITLTTDPSRSSAVVVPAGTQFSSAYVEAVDSPITFETVEDVTVPGGGGTATVGIAEGQTRTLLEIGVSDGMANQRMVIPQTNIIDGSIKIHVETIDGQIPWTTLPRLLFAGASDEVYACRPNADHTVTVIFGDGVSGAIPPLGARIFATYRHGVGEAGNLVAGKIGYLSSPTPELAGLTVAVDGAGNPVSSATTGGSGPEPLDTIRRNAAIAFSAYGRAVTTADYARIALTVPGVTHANAVSAVSSSVTVYLAGPARSTPTPDLIAAAKEQLTAAAMGGVTVTVQGHTKVGVNFGSAPNPLRLTVGPHQRNLVVESQVKTTLTNLLRSPDLGFGSRLTVGAVYNALVAIPGVVNITVPLMARADAPQVGVDDIVFAPFELPDIGSIAITTTGGITT